MEKGNEKIEIQEKSLDLSNPDQMILLRNQIPKMSLYWPSDASNLNKINFFHLPTQNEGESTLRAFFYFKGLIRVFSLSKEAGIRFESDFRLQDYKSEVAKFGKDKLGYPQNNSHHHIYNPQTRKLARVICLSSRGGFVNRFYQEVDLRQPSSTKQVLLKTPFIPKKDVLGYKIFLPHDLSIRSWLRYSLFGNANTKNNLDPKKIPNVELSASKTFYKRLNKPHSFKIFKNQTSGSSPNKNLLSLLSCNPTKKEVVVMNKRLSHTLVIVERLLGVIKVFDRHRLKVVKVIEFDSVEPILDLIRAEQLDLKKVRLRKCEIDVDLLDDTLEMTITLGLPPPTNTNLPVVRAEYHLIAKNYLLRGGERKLTFRRRKEGVSGIRRCFLGPLRYSSEIGNKCLEVRIFEKEDLENPIKEVSIQIPSKGLGELTEITDLGFLDQDKTMLFKDSFFLYLVDLESSKITSRARYRASSEIVGLEMTGKLCHKMFANHDGVIKIEFLKHNGNQVFEAGHTSVTKLLENQNRYFNVKSQKECKMAESSEKELSLHYSFSYDRYTKTILVVYLDKDSLELSSPPIANKFKEFCQRNNSNFSPWTYYRGTDCWQTAGVSKNPPSILKLTVGRTLNEDFRKETILLEHINPLYKDRKKVEGVRFIRGYAYIQCRDKSLLQNHLEAYDVRKSGGEGHWHKIGGIEADSDTYQFCQGEEGLMVLIHKKHYKTKTSSVWITNHKLKVMYKLEFLNRPRDLTFNEVKMIFFPEVFDKNKLLLRVGSRMENRSYGFFYLLNLDDLSLTGFKETGEDQGGSTGSHGEGDGQFGLKQLTLRFWDSDLIQLDNYQFLVTK